MYLLIFLKVTYRENSSELLIQTTKKQGYHLKFKIYVVLIFPILEISELIWTGMGEFNSDDQYIYYCAQESLRRNGVAIMVNKRVQSAVLGCNLKNDRTVSTRFQGKPFNVTVIQIYAPTSWRNWNWMALWRPIRPSRTNTQKRCLFHYRGLECKSRMSRDIWNNRQIWLWGIKWSRKKATRIFPENTLVIGNTFFQQHKRELYTWTSPVGQYQSQIDYIFCSQRWRCSIQSAKTRLRADCGSDHELLIAKFRLKLKKVGKTTRPFRYDLNQIPYDITVEVTHRFKGLDLTECLRNYGQRFMTLYRRQWSRSSPRKRKARGQNDCLRRSYK